MTRSGHHRFAVLSKPGSKIILQEARYFISFHLLLIEVLVCKILKKWTKGILIVMPPAMSRTSRRVPSAAIAAILVAIPVVHVFSVLIAGMNTPGYVTRLEPISNLALFNSPYRYLAIWGGLIVPGAALAGVSAWVVRSHLFGRWGEVGLALAAVCGLGMVLCGAFNYQSPVHIISVIASACLSAPAIVLIALDHPAWSNRPTPKALSCLWALFPVADVSGTIYAMRHGRFLHDYVGLQQRLSVGGTLCLFSLMILAAMYRQRHNNRGTTMGSAPDI